MSQLTTHILDTSKGNKLHITVILFQQHNNEWENIAAGKTNSDGRIPDLLQAESVLSSTYKLSLKQRPFW